MKTKILILGMAATLPASWTLAQNPGGPPRPPGPPPKEGPRRPGPRDGDQNNKDANKDAPRDGQRPPGPMPMPFLHALDKDDDGIISADEIKGASDSLKTLDKNHDGQLTRDEWEPLPPRPPEGDAQRKAGPRDGTRPAGAAPRDGDAKPAEKKPGDWPFGKDKTATPSDAKDAAAKPPADAPAKRERPPGPPSPLVDALDTDHDGVISADEIGKAPESLAKLDKNNDGQLGPREYGPPPPPQGQPPRDGDKPEAKPAQ